MTVRLIHGDCREVLATLPAESVHCCVTSPPYFGLRDYGVDGQIGLEATPAAYVEQMVAVFREVRRVLRDDGTLWLNLGDSYTGSANNGGEASKTMQGTQAATGKNLPSKRGEGLKPKDLIGIPWRVAFALQADGWYLRQDIIWAKKNPMPESVRDRCTKAHEYVFLMSKSERYYWDREAMQEPATDPATIRGKVQLQRATEVSGAGEVFRTRNGLDNQAPRETRNRRSVWPIASQPFSEAHFATMPPELAELCIRAGCPEGGTVLDPFGGAGTTGLVADRLQRHATLIELNPEYLQMQRRRITGESPLFSEVAA